MGSYYEEKIETLIPSIDETFNKKGIPKYPVELTVLNSRPPTNPVEELNIGLIWGIIQRHMNGANISVKKDDQYPRYNIRLYYKQLYQYYCLPASLGISIVIKLAPQIPPQFIDGLSTMLMIPYPDNSDTTPNIESVINGKHVIDAFEESELLTLRLSVESFVKKVFFPMVGQLDSAYSNMIVETI